MQQERLINPVSYDFSSTILYQASCLVGSNRPEKKVDAVFLHARSFGDDDGLFELASDLTWRGHGLARFVVINGSDGESWGDPDKKAWPGKDYYIQELKRHGIAEPLIRLSEPALHSTEENRCFLRMAQKKGWTSGVIIAQPHQLLRLMLGAVKVINETRMSFRLHCASPPYTDWSKPVQASQAENRDCRLDDITVELGKIKKYCSLGFIATLSELITFLRKQDQEQ